MAAWIPYMFCNFYYVKYHIIAAESREKISKDFEPPELYNFYAYWNNLKTNQIDPIKDIY